jgi:hypothetical protein
VARVGATRGREGACSRLLVLVAAPGPERPGCPLKWELRRRSVDMSQHDGGMPRKGPVTFRRSTPAPAASPGPLPAPRPLAQGPPQSGLARALARAMAPTSTAPVVAEPGRVEGPSSARRGAGQGEERLPGIGRCRRGRSRGAGRSIGSEYLFSMQQSRWGRVSTVRKGWRACV